MNENIYFAVIAFLVLSFLIVLFFYFKEKNMNQSLHVKLEELQNSYFTISNSYEQLKEDYNALEIEYAVLNARYTDEMKASSEKLEVLKNAKDELSQEFKILANKIFEDKSKQFSTSNKEQLELLLKPFREQIMNFSKEARSQFEVELKERHLLKDELGRLKLMNETLAQEALNLTNALKGENKTQGNWGELVLENILEQSGLREGVEYELQATLKSNEGKTYRPDVIIHMPQNRDIIVDSKVSLTAYERFVNAEEPEEKAKALKEHIASISSHIKELSAKNMKSLKA